MQAAQRRDTLKKETSPWGGVLPCNTAFRKKRKKKESFPWGKGGNFGLGGVLHRVWSSKFNNRIKLCTSFACPSLGIKCDAYPGRLNQASVYINRPGVFFGQCSEICGILHSSMPIAIESVTIEKFVS